MGSITKIKVLDGFEFSLCQGSDGNMIGSLRVIHTPGHTPGHISLYYKEDRIIFGADSIYKHVFGADGMYVSAPQVSMIQ